MDNIQDNNGSYSVAVQVLTDPKQVLIRSYVFILRYNSFYKTGTGPWHTPVS